MGNIFDTLLVIPFINILVAIYQGLFFLHIPFALGFAIILLTIIIRLIIYPFMQQSLKHQKRIQELQPHVNRIKEKHKNDTKRQQMEMMAMYKEQGVNPAGGCLFIIIQFPILIALYQVLFKIVNVKSLNEINQLLYYPQLKLTQLWDTTFFGVPLEKTPAQLLSQMVIFVIAIVVLTGALQMIQSKMMMPVKTEEEKQKAKSGRSPEDFATTFQNQSILLMPIIIGFASYTLPVGLSLYWNTLTIFGIIQQYRVTKWGGLVEWFGKLKKNN